MRPGAQALHRTCPQGLACHTCKALGTQRVRRWPRLHQQMAAQRLPSWADSRWKTPRVSAPAPCRTSERIALQKLSDICCLITSCCCTGIVCNQMPLKLNHMQVCASGVK